MFTNELHAGFRELASMHIDEGRTKVAMSILEQLVLDTEGCCWQDFHLLAICCGMRGDATRATVLFEKALGICEVSLGQAMLWRDYGVSLLASDLPTAFRYIERSLFLLGPSHKIGEDPMFEQTERFRRIQHAIGLSCLGIAYLKKGDVDSAEGYLRSADIQLRGKLTRAELDTLVYLKQISGIRARRMYAVRIRVLRCEIAQRYHR